MIQRSAKVVFPTPDGPMTSEASPRLIPPGISRSRPGTPLLIRSATGATAAAGMSVSIRGKTRMPSESIWKVCLPGTLLPPRIFTTRSVRRSTGSRTSYSSSMMPSARENSTPLPSSSGVYSPSSSSTVRVSAKRPVRSYSAPRNSRSSAKSRSILALSTTTTAGSSSSVFLTISATSGPSPSGRAGRRKSPRWMCSTREPSEPLSKNENGSRCLTSLVSGSDTVV